MASITKFCLWLYNLTGEKSFSLNKSKVVFITGCDSGLGFSLAQNILRAGGSVVAGCLRPLDEGAGLLKDMGAHVLQLNVTSRPSVCEAARNVSKLLAGNDNQLVGVVNNAAIMVFGEFEWQTTDQMVQQINVNLMGSFHIAHVFLPMLRNDQGRLINIVSHCAMAGLPGLSIYGASKAALLNWNDTLRVEQSKYGVKVVSFVPGSFYGQSNIMAQQNKFANEMLTSMSRNSREFHDAYFQKVQKYVAHLPRSPSLQIIQDEELNAKLMHAVFAKYAKPHYVHQPWRYAVYHWLFKISPVWLRDFLIQRFVSLPKYP